ncbi:MAG: GyrI-like domain-containing protein, partial [Aeromicrobium sp.]
LVTADLARSVIAAVQSKRPDLQVGDLRMVRLDEGPAAQVMHIGPYTTEGPTIERLHAFIHDHGLEFDGIRHKHHEIYLNDPRRTRPDRLRTIIRQPYWPRRATVGRHPLATDAASLG